MTQLRASISKYPRTTPRTATPDNGGGLLITSSSERSWGGRGRTSNFLINSQVPVSDGDALPSSTRLKIARFSAVCRRLNVGGMTGSPRTSPRTFAFSNSCVSGSSLSVGGAQK